ncbi:hypothetical protein THICB2_170012 [Thiomonas sp. CB2]|nr:hypothetical protein THICB2_170012 [Thiomonas sp. CB2]VDY10854.1 protein of unknown function [Thiomonas sp. Sup16B3]VDY14112.1 conserved protein of unknown function [Thiomonas sp. OC7]VDY16693.1 protein of unknown function [Thiomonas sp. CB2]
MEHPGQFCVGITFKSGSIFIRHEQARPSVVTSSSRSGIRAFAQGCGETVQAARQGCGMVAVQALAVKPWGNPGGQSTGRFGGILGESRGNLFPLNPVLEENNPTAWVWACSISSCFSFVLLVRPAGIEPATLGFGGQYSIH